MPQMFPMYWLNQYIYFMSLYYIFILSIFYLTKPSPIKAIENNLKMYYKTKKMNWKW